MKRFFLANAASASLLASLGEQLAIHEVIRVSVVQTTLFFDSALADTLAVSRPNPLKNPDE